MSQAIHTQMTARDIMMLVVLSILWGGSFFFIEVLVEHLPPLTLVTLRVGLAAIALWGIVCFRKIKLPQKASHWGALVLIGALNNALPFCLITWGQTQIDSGLASILNATTPFFTVVLAGAFLTDEKITKGKFWGVLIGLVGTVVMIGPEALRGISGSVLGQLAVMGAALSYGIAAVYSRRFKDIGLSPLMIATGQVTMAAIILLPLTLMIDQPWTLAMPGLDVWIYMAGLAFFSTVLAYILYFKLIESAGATNAALVTFLIPISAILLGVLILGESFTTLQGIGMALIGLGLLVMDGRILKKFHKRS